mmetsp:Transcript_33491/g.50521  ORF Transcript_33491/g.50521 Transcript_33491/m.50521 type:complete len:511 (-) Transcript_33491:638-2170(-)|eukprot:CAMPEP_0178922994 /NCGR_PEP_ID=MMETSP0786-20121207/16471_1 /TAXON_ID=186022 /ORGANISM="Thalassionema frauenfeldii, Strain CCMP 1798" /LENGTH=510 /DNA_ID=CAMNT_0020597437 /DNA_START=156 /DNA_END=1688 /DNA_ORIENTATION=-
MREADSVIARRLKSSWGRLVREKGVEESRLHRMIGYTESSNPDWEAILQFVREHPDEVMKRDRRGRTGLSSACAKNPPSKVVEEMMKCCKFGIEASRDKTGFTALSIAIMASASMDVIQELCKSLELTKTADHQNNTPLHLACNNFYANNLEELVSVLLEVCPQSANLINFEGLTPLQIALESNGSHSIIEMLVKAAPESVLGNANGTTPLTRAILCNWDFSICSLLVGANPKVLRLRDEEGRLPLHLALDQRNFFNPDIISLLIYSKEAVLEEDKSGRNSLHRVLDNYEVNPLKVSMLLEATPESGQKTTKDGQLPIQIAYKNYLRAKEQASLQPQSLLAQGRLAKCWNVIEMFLEKSTCTCNLHHAIETLAPIEVIEIILLKSPEEAAISNHDFEFPIMLAAKLNHCHKDRLLNLILDADSTTSSCLDKEQRSVLSIAAECTDIKACTIYRLICAHPSALRQLDPIRNLQPLLIAASNESDEVDVVYEILLAAPDLIHDVGNGGSKYS